MRPRIRTAAAAVLTALALSACDAAPPPADEPPAGGDAAALGAERPHFVGERPVDIAVGQLGVGGGCGPTPVPPWVCDRDDDRAHRVHGELAPATLREARMDVAGGGTSWTVTLRLDRDDRRTLREVRERAGGRGAVVLVLDGEAMLAAAAVPDVERARIRLTQLDKPAAWEAVRRVVEE